MHQGWHQFYSVSELWPQEGANVTHIVNKLDAVLGSLDQSEETDGEQPKVIKQHIIDIRNNLSEQGATKDFI